MGTPKETENMLASGNTSNMHITAPGYLRGASVDSMANAKATAAAGSTGAM